MFGDSIWFLLTDWSACISAFYYLHLALTLEQGVSHTTFVPEQPELVTKVASDNFLRPTGLEGLSATITRLAGNVPTQGFSVQVFGLGANAPMTGVQAAILTPVSRT